MDYGQTPYAARNRWEKAHRIAAWCWTHGLTWEHLEYCADPEWAALCRAAGEKRAASEDTRRLVQALVTTKQAWAAANPNHPEARRTVRTPDQVAALTTGARA